MCHNFKKRNYISQAGRPSTKIAGLDNDGRHTPTIGTKSVIAHGTAVQTVAQALDYFLKGFDVG